MSKSGFYLSWILVHLFVLQVSSRISAIRKDIGFQEKPICRNTVQGRYLLSDDNGHICDALSVDPQSRCCPGKGEKFSCHGCNLLSQCCNSYEFCVSCCLNPARTQKEQVLKVKMAKQSTAGTYSSVFDFCAGRCRHNSESVVHENAYISDFHHCFSLPSNSSAQEEPHPRPTWRRARDTADRASVPRRAASCHVVSPTRANSASTCADSRRFGPNRIILAEYRRVSAGKRKSAAGATNANLEGRLNGINVIVGRQGESCDSVCKSNGQSCVPNKLLVLNQCDIMQKYMSCKGACLASMGPDQPAEVVDDAPKNLNPGACLFTRTQSMLSCEGSHLYTRRLCPCA